MLDYLFEKLERVGSGLYIYNLGTGTGYSVLEIVDAFERVNNVKVNYKIVGRRPGDIATCYADPALAHDDLGWDATRGIDEMCRDAYNFIVKQSEKK